MAARPGCATLAEPAENGRERDEALVVVVVLGKALALDCDSGQLHLENEVVERLADLCKAAREWRG